MPADENTLKHIKKIYQDDSEKIKNKIYEIKNIKLAECSDECIHADIAYYLTLNHGISKFRFFPCTFLPTKL